MPITSPSPDEPKGNVRKALPPSLAALQRWRDRDHEDAITLSRHEVVTLIEETRAALPSPSQDGREALSLAVEKAMEVFDRGLAHRRADEALRRAGTEDGCSCQGCGARYRVDFLVPDDVWARISPKSNGGGLLCGQCIVQRIEALGEFGAYHLTGDVRKALNLLETIIIRCEECWLHGITKLAREAKAALSTPGRAREGGE